MAIKITKPGQKEFHGFCTWCGCEFTYEISDLTLSATGNKLYCPTCGKDYFHQSMVQDPTIPGGLGRLQTWPPEPIPCTPDMTKTDPCAGCIWRENLYRDGIYVGDTPCTWCDKNKFNNIAEYNQNFKDYITCTVKAPEAHLSGSRKSCNCGENAVCSICSSSPDTVTTAYNGASADSAISCLCEGDVWASCGCSCCDSDSNATKTAVEAAQINCEHTLSKRNKSTKASN